jgi:hypothetical protein
MLAKGVQTRADARAVTEGHAGDLFGEARSALAVVAVGTVAKLTPHRARL